MQQFVSEVIAPAGGEFDTAAMGRGEPGLPVQFRWRGRDYTVLARLDHWKASEPEGGRPGGERYLRRHYYRLQMSDGLVWTVYFVRQPPRGGSPKKRWFLYTTS